MESKRPSFYYRLELDDYSAAAFTSFGKYYYGTLGYAANNYEGLELSPRDQYFKHADGRDGGLGEIDPDSPEAFSDWYRNRECR